MNHDHQNRGGGLVRGLFYLAVFSSLAIAAYFLIAEHRAHIFGEWSGPILLAAFVGVHLLMHLGHGGHGGHGGGHSSGGRRVSDEDSENER